MNTNANPKQIKLIGLLVVVLIGVVVVRMRPKSKPRPATTSQQTVSTPSAAVPQTAEARDESAAEERPLTPAVRLAELWKSNPFRGMTDAVEPVLEPDPEPQRKNAASERLLEELTGQSFGDGTEETTESGRHTPETKLRVSAILDDGKERRALVGNAIVAVGDELDGFEVVAIHSDRIELAALGESTHEPSHPANSE